MFRAICTALFIVGTSAAADLVVAVGAPGTPDGSVAHPYPTIAAAQAAASPGDRILLRTGVYRERITAVENHITIAAYPGLDPRDDESVTVTSFRIRTPGLDGVGSWEDRGGGLWRIQLPTVSGLARGQNMVRLGGKLLQEARWPNSPNIPDFTRNHAAWSDAASTLAENVNGNLDQAIYTDADLLAAGFVNNALVGGKLLFNPGYQWYVQSADVVANAGATLTCQYNWSGLDPTRPLGEDFYVVWGALACLDRIDEAFYDYTGNSGPAHMLYIRSSSNPSGKLLETRGSGSAIDLSWKSNIIVRGLHIEGTVAANDSASYCRFEGLDIQLPGYSLAPGGGLVLNGHGNEAIDTVVTDCSGNGIVTRHWSGATSSNAVIRDCVVQRVGQNGIGGNYAIGRNVSFSTMMDTGQASIHLNHVNSVYASIHNTRAGWLASDITMMNVSPGNGTRLNAVVRGCWAYDARSHYVPGGRWQGCGGYRVDNGGNLGATGIDFIRNLQWDCEYGISIFDIVPGQTGFPNADCRVINNTVADELYILGHSNGSAKGIEIAGNLAGRLRIIGSQPATAATRYERNWSFWQKPDDPAFGGYGGPLSPGGRLPVPVSGSPLVNAGLTYAGLNQVSDNQPDIGAFEAGTVPPPAGARLTHRRLKGVTLDIRTRLDGSRWAVLDNVPQGRLIDPSARLRLGGQMLGNLRFLYDPRIDQGEIWFPADAALNALSGNTALAEIDLGNGQWITLGSKDLARPRIDKAVAYPNGILVLSGANLPPHRGNLRRLPMSDTVRDDLFHRPVLVNITGPGATGAIWAEVGGELIQVDRQWLGGGSTWAWCRIRGGDSGLFPFGSVPLTWWVEEAPAPSPVTTNLTSGWPILGSTHLLYWLQAGSLNPGPVDNWTNRGFTFSGTGTSRPTMIRDAFAGMPGVSFDGNDGLFCSTTVPDGLATVYANIAMPSPGSQRYQRIFSSVRTSPDHINGITLSPANVNGDITVQPLPRHVYMRGTTARQCSPAWLGQDNNEGQPLTGIIGELLFFNTTLNWQDWDQVRMYLRTVNGEIPGQRGPIPLAAPDRLATTVPVNGNPAPTLSGGGTMLTLKPGILPNIGALITVNLPFGPPGGLTITVSSGQGPQVTTSATASPQAVPLP